HLAGSVTAGATGAVRSALGYARRVSLRVLESRNRRLVIGVLATFLVAVFVAQAAAGGVNDPTDPTTRMSHSAVVFDSALLVFREGLQGVLLLCRVPRHSMCSH